MESKSTPESGKPAPELQDSTALETPAANYSNRNKINLVLADFTLRILLFASTLTAVLVMVTSKQTVLVPVLTLLIPTPAKFNYSPAFIYFVVALSVTCLYSILTTLASLMAIWKRFPSYKLLVHFALLDVLMLGLVASATGTAGGVAYIGLKGNSHVQWAKVCNLYDKFCRHVGASVAISLFASFLLVLLMMISIFSLSRRTH